MSDGASPFLRCIERLHREAPAAPLVVLTPSQSEARTVRAALLRRKAARTGVWVTAPLQLARQIGRTHPSNRQGPLVTPEATREILSDALASLPDAAREALAPKHGSGDAQNGSLDTVAEAMAPIVRRLRENDISPATLYALSIGRSVTPEQRALAAGYEAYDRHLLDGPHVGASDIFSAATAQIRTGRVSWLDDATITAFDSIALPETGATFVQALRDAAPSFLRLGPPNPPSNPPSIPPSDTVAARFDAPRACPDARASDGSAEAANASSDATTGAEPTRSIRHEDADTLAAAADHIAEAVRASNHDPGDIEVAVPNASMDAARTALEQADLPVSTQPAAAGKQAPVLLSTLPAAGYTGREHLYIVTAGETTDGPEPVTLMGAGDWEKLEGLTDTVLPHDASASTGWHAAQIQWRHAGRVTVAGPAGAWHDAFRATAQ